MKKRCGLMEIVATVSIFWLYLGDLNLERYRKRSSSHPEHSFFVGVSYQIWPLSVLRPNTWWDWAVFHTFEPLWGSITSFLEHKSVCISPTWTGGSWGGRSNPLDQNLVIFSQSLLSQIALPFDEDLQRLRHIRYDPVDRSQHKENDVLGLRKELMLSTDKNTKHNGNLGLSVRPLNNCSTYGTLFLEWYLNFFLCCFKNKSYINW